MASKKKIKGPSKIQKDYNDKRVQVVQVTCQNNSSEHKALLKAIDKLKRVKGYSDTKAVFVSSVLEAADNADKKST